MKPSVAPLAAAFTLAAAFASPAFAAKDVVAAVASTFTTMDPYDANDTLSQAVVKSFYQGLYGFDRTMKMVPVLAESHEASKDGLTYTVKLKRGIKFHDGTDFNAEAVKVTFDRVTNPENKLKRYTLYKNIAKTEVIDPYTVRFTLKEPFSPFINSLAHPSGVIISPAALQKYGKDIARNPVGTGPFKFVEWKQSDYLKVEKFAGYWRKGYPKVDTITFRPVVDNNSRAAMMQTNEAHFTFPVPYEQAEVLKGKPNLELVAAPSIVHRYLSMNTLQKPFDNVKVREAINYAINKEALAKVAFSGYAIPAEGVLPKGVEYAVKLGPWPYDPAKARALLKEAGYPNGFETSLWSAYNHTTAQKVIQFLQQQLAQVGIKALEAKWPLGYAIQVAGAVEESSKGSSSIAAGLPIMLFITLTLLMLQLHSFSRAMLVFLTGPLGIAGVAGALLALGRPFGFVALLGVIALMGMIQRNSVILIDQIEQDRAKGVPTWTAIVESAVRRLRPIVLTAAAAVLAMIPLSRSVFWGPMAVAIMGGLIVATVLTLLALPAMYAAWFRVQREPPETGPAMGGVPAAA